MLKKKKLKKKKTINNELSVEKECLLWSGLNGHIKPHFSRIGAYTIPIEKEENT